MTWITERMPSWAADRGRRLPPWNRITVLEDENGKRSDMWIDIEAFEPRFQEILERTSRPWVNVQAEGIEEGELRIVVEYRTEPGETAAGQTWWDGSRISVNLSGPAQSWWDGLQPA